jgi:hypothetical protein
MNRSGAQWNRNPNRHQGRTLVIQRIRLSAVVVFGLVLLACSGCAPRSGPDTLSRDIEPLRIRRPDGTTVTITVADAMAYHHAHEAHSEDEAMTDGHEPAQEEGLCAGVATGYQAIRYTVSELFAGQTPDASDLELSVAGSMRGVWDVLEMYVGRPLDRPEPKKGKGTMTLESFTFDARRVSTGRRISFRLREGLIPERFFELKGQGLSCDDPEVSAVKDKAARGILRASPRECFRRLD